MLLSLKASAYTIREGRKSLNVDIWHNVNKDSRLILLCKLNEKFVTANAINLNVANKAVKLRLMLIGLCI